MYCFTSQSVATVVAVHMNAPSMRRSPPYKQYRHRVSRIKGLLVGASCLYTIYDYHSASGLPPSLWGMPGCICNPCAVPWPV